MTIGVLLLVLLGPATPAWTRDAPRPGGIRGPVRPHHLSKISRPPTWSAAALTSCAGSGAVRCHRAGLERLPDAAHVLLVLPSHGHQGKGCNQPGQALRVELQVGDIACPWRGVGDGALEPDAHAPGLGVGLPPVRAIEPR